MATAAQPNSLPKGNSRAAQQPPGAWDNTIAAQI
jgi:hypothetical protein